MTKEEFSIFMACSDFALERNNEREWKFWDNEFDRLFRMATDIDKKLYL